MKVKITPVILGTLFTSGALAADPTSTVQLGPIVAAVSPYLLVVWGTVFPALAGLLFEVLRRKFNIQIENEQRARLTAAAQSWAGTIFAAGGAEIATKSISVGSPEVARAVTAIMDNLPRVVAALGMTPDRVATIVAGEIGKLQAAAQSGAPVAVGPPMQLPGAIQ